MSFIPGRIACSCSGFLYESFICLFFLLTVMMRHIFEPFGLEGLAIIIKQAQEEVLPVPGNHTQAEPGNPTTTIEHTEEFGSRFSGFYQRTLAAWAMCNSIWLCDNKTSILSCMLECSCVYFLSLAGTWHQGKEGGLFIPTAQKGNWSHWMGAVVRRCTVFKVSS